MGGHVLLSLAIHPDHRAPARIIGFQLLYISIEERDRTYARPGIKSERSERYRCGNAPVPMMIIRVPRRIHPSRQRDARGAGTALLHSALSRLRYMGLSVCAVGHRPVSVSSAINVRLSENRDAYHARSKQK